MSHGAAEIALRGPTKLVHGTGFAMCGAMDLLATTPLKQSAPSVLRAEDLAHPTDTAPAGAADAKSGFATDLAEEEAELSGNTFTTVAPTSASETEAVELPVTTTSGSFDADALNVAGIAAMNAFIFATIESPIAEPLPATNALIESVAMSSVMASQNTPSQSASTSLVGAPAPAPVSTGARELGTDAKTGATSQPLVADLGEKSAAATTTPATKPAGPTAIDTAGVTQQGKEISSISVNPFAANPSPTTTPTNTAPIASAIEATEVAQVVAPVTGSPTPQKTTRPVAARPTTGSEAPLAPLAADASTSAENDSAILPVTGVHASADEQAVLPHADTPAASSLATERGTLASLSTTHSQAPASAAAALSGQIPTTHAPTNIAVGGQDLQRALTPAERQFAVDEVRMHLVQARPEVTIILDPPALGEVHVHLMVQQGAVKAEIRAEHRDVAESLRAELATLRNALEDAGLTVADVQVKTRDDGRTATHNSAQHDLQREEQRAAAEGREKGADARAFTASDASPRRGTPARTTRTDTTNVTALDVTI